jgi:SnoaL-like protein
MQSSRSDPADTVLRFFRYLDDQEYDRIPNLFSSDGVWHRRDVATIGPDQIRQSFVDIPPVMPTVHLVTNLQIDQVSPHEAHVAFYVLVLRSSSGVNSASPPWPMEMPLMLTLYKTDLTSASGEWRITKMRNDPVFRR